MGQNNTGVVMRSGAETTLRYLQAKKKNRKTLTLKNTHNGKDHFQATADFSDSGARSVESSNSTATDGIIPVLTSAVVPVGGSIVPLEAIPVLDKPISTPASTTSSGKRARRSFRLTTALLAVIGVGILMNGGANREQSKVDTLTSMDSEPVPETVSLTQANRTSSTKVVDKTLVQNIVGLIVQENFSQNTTIEAFLSLWQQVDDATRATLNSSPWFLRFSFSLQKKARHYLQSPDSYYADYTIKFNALLKMALALGVMDHHGINSSIEGYYSKRNKLLETLQSEIATIEHASKNGNANGASIQELNKSFRDRFALQSRNITQAIPSTDIAQNKIPKSRPALDVSEKNDITKDKPSASIIDAHNDSHISEVMELDTLINSFVDAYERGDLDALTSLFSPTARTNDKNNLQDIREDYASLFNSSSFRLLNIINLRWEPGHNAIKGIGDYEIGIAMDDSGAARMLHGKIQFIVGRVNKQLLITRLYHLER